MTPESGARRARRTMSGVSTGTAGDRTPQWGSADLQRGCPMATVPLACMSCISQPPRVTLCLDPPTGPQDTRTRQQFGGRSRQSLSFICPARARALRLCCGNTARCSHSAYPIFHIRQHSLLMRVPGLGEAEDPTCDCVSNKSLIAREFGHTPVLTFLAKMRSGFTEHISNIALSGQLRSTVPQHGISIL